MQTSRSFQRVYRFLVRSYPITALSFKLRLVTYTSASVTGLFIPRDGGLKVTLPNHVSSVDFEVGANNSPLDVKAFDGNGNVVAKHTIPETVTPVAAQLSGKDIAYLLFETGANENVVAKVCISQPEQCDSSLICLQKLTCVDGKRYPTSCGPENCDKPISACKEESRVEK